MSSNRVRTRERRKQREQERQRNRRLLVVVAVVAIAVIGLVLVIISNQPTEVVIPESTVAQYTDIPQSANENGFPVLGDPEAPVQVVEYSSFACTACGAFYQNVVPAIVERVRQGSVSFTYVPLTEFGSIPNGEGAGRAAICAGEQDAFWVYHGTLFGWQTTYGNQALAGNRLSSLANNLELDTGAWNACLNSASTNDVIVAARGAASSLEGFTGTPTVLVNGEIVPNTLSDVTAAIDAALAASPAPAVQPTEAEPEATTEATAEVRE